MKKIIIKNKTQLNLIKIIGNDFLKHGKLPIFLLILIIFTSILVINTVYRTRLLVIRHEQLILKYIDLDSEWRNLIIKEINLSNYKKINPSCNRNSHI